MKNQSNLEKIFLILGAIILVIGLFQFMDFTNISKYTILFMFIAAQIVTNLVSFKTEKNLPKTSLILLIISWFLAIISLYYGAFVFDIMTGASYIVPCIIGTYSISLLNHKYYTPVNILAILWTQSFYIGFVSSDILLISLIGMACGILYLIYQVKIFLTHHKEHPFVSFMTTAIFLQILYSIFSMTWDSIDITYNSMLPLLLTSVSAFFILKSNILSDFRHYTNFFKIFALLTTINISSHIYWNDFLYDGMNGLIPAIIAFVIAEVIFIKAALKGDKLSFALVFIHFIVFAFTTVASFASTSIVLIFLGASLVTIGFILERKKNQALRKESIIE